MRSLRVEWLLLPLVLLPLAVAGTLCLVARGAYRAQVAPFRADPRGAIESHVSGAAGDAVRLRFHTAFGHVSVPTGAVAVPFSWAGREAVAWVPGAAAPSDWTFTSDLPAGLPAAALGDASVRLEIETGRRPCDLDSAPGAARAFAALLSEPDIDALRTAALPASTKAYVARRWLQREPGRAAWQSPAAILGLVAEAEPLLERARAPDALGVTRRGGAEVIARGPDAPLLVAPAGSVDAFLPAHVLQPTPDTEIRWTPRGEYVQPDGGRILWSGVLDAPVAGTWALLLPHGDAWWKSSLFRRWFPVAAALVLVLLMAPIALLISIRRRAKLDEARARFLNEIAHDLRTPLTSLRLYAEMLSGDDVERPARERYAGVIARESARLTALLANLLDLSRLEGGKRLYDIQDVGVAAAVAAAVADFRALYPARAHDVSVAGDAGLAARADPTALARCLGNLLDNAGKFTAPGTAIGVTWTRAGDDVRVTVVDEGDGIADRERAAIFGRYVRGAGAQADGVQGTGLGLSLVRELMAGMRGDVTLVEGKGAAFMLRLPGADVAERAADVHEPAATGGDGA